MQARKIAKHRSGNKRLPRMTHDNNWLFCGFDTCFLPLTRLTPPLRCMNPASMLALDGAAPLCRARCPPTPSASPTPSLLTSSQRTAALQSIPRIAGRRTVVTEGTRVHSCRTSFSSTRVPRSDAISNGPASSTSTASLGRALRRWLRAHMCSLVGGHSHVHSTVPKGTVRVRSSM